MINFSICKFFYFFLLIEAFCVPLAKNQKKMKLGVLLPHTKLYGGVKRFLELGNIFVEKGHDFYVLTPDGTPPGWFDFKGVVTTFGQLQGLNLDALWTTTPDYMPMVLHSTAKHKIFYHVRIKEKLAPILKNPEVELFACSSNVYSSDLKKYGRQAFKAVGGVTVRHYSPKDNYEVVDRPFVVMGYGRLAESVKGTRYVVKACERLYKKGFNIKLLLFDTHVSEKMQQKYERFHCDCPYEFVLDHPFDRNSELFGRADCFVSAENPKYSGWNNTVAEAMACALPVISTKAGTDDLLIDGVNGIRSARWVFCFEKHIARLYHDEQLRERLGQAARQHILQFDWEVVADNILKYLG